MEDLSCFGIQLSNVTSIDTLDEDELNSRIISLNESSSTSYEVGRQEYYDEINLLVNSFTNLSPRNKLALVEVMSDINAQILDNLEKNTIDEDDRPKVRLTLYLCQHVWEKAELIAKTEVKSTSKDEDDEDDDGRKKKSKGKSKTKSGYEEFSWLYWRKIYLNIMERIISSDPSHLWSMSIIPEIFLVGIWRNALNLLENKPVGVCGTGHQEIKIRHDCEKLIAGCVSRFGSTSSSGAISSLSAAMIDSIVRAEHMGVSVANICRQSNSAIINEIMTELSHMNMAALPGSSVKHVSNFFDSFAEGSPELMTVYFPLIKQLVDSPAHQIRSSLLFAMSIVVMHIHRSSENIDLNLMESSEALESEDIDCNKRNLNQLSRVRDSMLDIIVERTHDVNHYTRAQVLKIWISILENNAVPVRRYGTVCEIALDRLMDKTASVRKNAVSLLSSLIENNPFSGDLDITTFESNKSRLNAALTARIEQLRSTSTDDCLTDNTEKLTPVDDPFLSSPDVLEDSEVISIKNQLEFCEGGLKLITSIMTTFPKIEEMLKSKTTGDVVEALRFFMKAAKFNIKGSAKCLRLTFSLVWHLDPAIQKECIASFRHVYLTDGAVSGDLQELEADEIAKNLVELCKRCDLSEVASMERIVGDLFHEGLVDLAVVQALWNCLNSTYNSRSISPLEDYEISEMTEAGSVIRVISMIAKSVPSTFDDIHIKILNQYVFSTDSLLRKDFSALKAACQCLQTVQVYTMASKELRNVMLEVAGGLSNVICGIFCGDNEEITKSWFGVCEEAMHTLFHIHPCPDKVVGTMIAPLYQSLSSSNNLTCSAAALARFLFILGQCALCSLVFTERVANEAKKAAEKKNKDTKKADATNEVDAMEEEMGMAAAADADHERIFNLITEQHIVYDNVLSKFHPLIGFVVANEKAAFSNSLLRESAVLALCRYMSVSSILCESYLPLLFTVFNQEQSPVIRTTIMIALGDLAFRFPNSLEPWTAHMYSKLTDSDVNVRHNTLMVLTHLALNDMIKIKGQVSHIVCCLTDSNEAIRDLAALFFIKLSERSNNPVYNLLGDIIASLSRDRESNIEAEANINKDTVVVAALEDNITQTRTLTAAEFQTTMHFLLSFVKKDKQADGLLQRLLIRIGMAQSNCQRRYLAFCISELQITDKGVKSMIENIKHIKDALYDSEVFELFKLTIAKVKKTSKGATGADARSAVDEFENLMEVIRSCASGEDVEAVLNVASTGSEPKENNEGSTFIEKPKKKQVVKKTTRRKATKAKTYDEDDDEEEDDEIDEKLPTTTSSRRRKPLEEVN